MVGSALLSVNSGNNSDWGYRVPIRPSSEPEMQHAWMKLHSQPKSRRELTSDAIQLFKQTKIQDELRSRFGLFIWKIEKWPNWLRVQVDKVGNSTGDEKVVKEAVSQAGDDLLSILKKVFEPVDKEIYVAGVPIGNRPGGHCCRTGCHGCFNGVKDALLSLLAGPEKG
jgi:hypothetical protein